MSENTFTVNEIDFRVIAITNNIRTESQKVLARSMNEALKIGMPLKIEVERTLEDRNLLNSASEERQINSLRRDIRTMEVRLRTRKGAGDDLMTKDQGRILALEMRKERLSINEVGRSLADLYNNTAENYSANEQMQYFIYACTVKAGDGENYWKTFDDMKADMEDEVYEQAARTFLSVMMGVDRDFERKHYEVQWLMKMGFMSENLRLINSDGNFVDEEDRLINEDGQYVTVDGDLVDEFGNVVDSDGNLAVEDAWEETPPAEEAVVAEVVPVPIEATEG